MSAKRNFADWITAYTTYARDGFSPDKFHLWTGFSVLAASLERKVWVNLGAKRKHIFPNIYVFLISKPAIGKSTAMDTGVNDILKQIETPEGGIVFLPNQLSEASFYKKFSEGEKRFLWGKQLISHCSGYLYLSEASNSLKEMAGGGELTSAMTEFYDCASSWEKSLVTRKGEVIHNICCNALVGSTFNFLGILIPQRNIMGGFASRLLYVVQSDSMVRSPDLEPDRPEDHDKIQKALIEDLSQVHRLTGKFRYEKAFNDEWKRWYAGNDRYVQGLKSERMQALLGRVPTNTLKLAMLCSVSESDEMILRMRHWERAMELIQTLLLDLDKVLTAGQEGKDQRSVNSIIMTMIKQAPDGEAPQKAVIQKLLQAGVDPTKVMATISTMQNNSILSINLRGGKTYLKALVDPNDYL